MQRSTASGLVLALGPGLLAACGDDGGGSTGGGTATSGGGGATPGEFSGPVAYQRPVPAGVVFEQMGQGAEAAARTFGLKMNLYDYNADNDKALAQMDQMGTQGVTAITTLILDNGITRQLADAAVRNDVWYHTWAQIGQWVFPSEESIQYHYQALANPPDGAYAICKGMFEKLGGRGTFAHITGAAGSATSLAKDKAVDRALAEFPGIRLVARERGNYDRETSRRALSNILAKTGGELDAVYNQSDDSGVGALDALREAGLIGRTLVGGADGIPEFIDAIIAGDAYGTEGAVPIFGSGLGIVKGLDVAAGWKPEPIETLMVQDLLIIDNRESAQIYKDLALGRGTALFDYELMSRTLHPDDWDMQWPLRAIVPEEFWTRNQDVPKPDGFEIPEDYVKAVEDGGYEKTNQMYADHLKRFPLEDVAKASSTGKTLFEQLYG